MIYLYNLPVEIIAMRRLLLLFLSLTPVLLQAQDVTGIWQGHFRSSGSRWSHASVFDERYRFEVQIAQRGKSLEGVTYSYLSSFFYGKAAAVGTVNLHTQKVMLEEVKILEFRNPGNDVCTMTCFLQYSKSGGEEFLEGTYVSMDTRDSSNCGRGTVFLRKVPMSDFYTEPFVARREQEIKDSLSKVATAPPAAKTTPAARTTPAGRPSKPATASARPVHRPSKPATVSTPPPADRNPPPMARVTVPKETMRQPANDSSGGIGRKFPAIVPGVIKDRENQTVRTLVVHTTEVTLNIYDDGAIDHDTVSVYLDNKAVLLHRMLTDRPLVVTIHLDETNDYHEVVMVADNEGEIPPNTSLMIVKAGDKEYEVRITSTEQKNAVVKFQYAK